MKKAQEVYPLLNVVRVRAYPVLLEAADQEQIDVNQSDNVA